MDPVFARQYAEGISGLDRFTGTMTFTLLAVDGAPCGDVPPGGIAIVGGNGPRAPGGELASVIVPPYGSNYSQTLMLAQYIGLSISKGNSGGSNNNGGTSDSDDGIIHDDEVSRSPRYFRVPPSIEDPSNPCGGGDEVGILEPLLDNEHCKKLKELSDNTNVKAALVDLKGPKLSQNRENGYILRDGPGYTTPEVLPPGPVDGSSIKIPVGNDRFGACHTHQNDGKSIPMFSPEDIILLFQLQRHYAYSNYNQVAMMPKFVFTVTTAQGTYAIKIDGQNFYNIMNDIVNDPLKKKEFIEKLKTQQERKKSNESDHVHQKVFLEFIGSKNLNMSIYKANNDFTSWDKLELDSSAPNGVKKQKCK